MNALTNTMTRIAELQETIALCTADLRHCNTRAQVQSVNAVIAARKAELLALEEKAQERARGHFKRAVAALDEAGTGEHNVYVHWFRIGYGCWLDAEEVVNAGGLADYLEALGLSAADAAELMTQDWDCQDAEGLASRFLGSYGGFDWLGFEELLEVTADTDEAVVLAALDAGLPADEAGERFIGTWERSEDMAYDQWEQGGMLDAVPEAVRSYIDWEAVARDMLLSGVLESRGYYFHAC